MQKLARFILDQGVQIPDEIKLPDNLSLVPEETRAGEWSSQQGHQHADGIGNQTHSTMHQDGPGAELISGTNDLLRLGDLDPLAVGMEFVLT